MSFVAAAVVVSCSGGDTAGTSTSVSTPLTQTSTTTAGGTDSTAATEALTTTPAATATTDEVEPTFAYELNGSLTDEHGGPALVGHGGTIGPSSYTFGPNEGLSLEAALGDSYTIEIRFRLHGARLGTFEWAKLIDFGDRNSDAGFYVYEDSLQIYFSEGCEGVVANEQGCFAPGGRIAMNAHPSTIEFDTFLTLRILRDGESAELTAYVDGVLQSWTPDTDESNPVGFVYDPAGETEQNSSEILHFMIDDEVTGSEARGGEIDYIRIIIR